MEGTRTAHQHVVVFFLPNDVKVVLEQAFPIEHKVLQRENAWDVILSLEGRNHSVEIENDELATAHRVDQGLADLLGRLLSRLGLMKNHFFNLAVELDQLGRVIEVCCCLATHVSYEQKFSFLARIVDSVV